jgi:hypothetical protein
LVSNILANETFSSMFNASTGDRTLLVSFNSSYLPGGTLNSLQVVRSESDLADPGTSSASPSLPDYRGAFTKYALDGTNTRTDLGVDIWKANPFTSSDPNFSCSIAFCVAP